MDSNGILNVNAKDKATGREQSVRITASTNLSKEDIDRMVREAEANADTDRKAVERAEAKNKGETLLLAAKRSLEDLGADVPGDAKAEVETAIAALDRSLKGSDLDEVIRLTEDLKQSQYRMTEAIYRAQDAAAAASYETAPPSEEGGETEVVE